MFGRNCKVDDAVALRAQSAAIPQGDVYQPVRCATCNTQVGVQDSDEVYHFVHVVASNA